MKPSKQTIAAIRFGYGFNPRQEPPRDADDLLSGLALGHTEAGDIGGAPMRQRAEMFRTFFELQSRNRNNNLKSEIQAIRAEVKAMFLADVRRRIMTPVRSPHGFFERLSWFWADHFSVSANALRARTLVGRFEADAIRPNLNGKFADLLRATTTHPMMIDFLNQTGSIGPNSRAGRKLNKGLNENLAREIIELHTLGVGANYSQNDVRQFAELLTGLSYERFTFEPTFLRARAEPGAETVLGKDYGGGREPRIEDIYRALDDLAAHPATARHIATKLARYFTADDPSASLIAGLETAFLQSDGDLPTVYAALLDHPDSWSSFGQKVKQPFDFVVSSLRAIGPDDEEIALFQQGKDQSTRPERPLSRMNQMPFQPPGPQGWPVAAEAWITAQGLSERIDWASRLARHAEPRIDPRDFLETTLGEHVSDETTFAATRAAERWEGIALVLASPEFNRQ